MRRAMILIPVLLWACGGDAPPSAGPPVQIVSGDIQQHKAGSPGGFADVAYACCDTPARTAVVGAFVGLGEALAADDGARALERAGAMRAAVGALGADDAEPSQQMGALLDRMASKEIGDVREEFLDLSAVMLPWAKAHGGGDALTIAVAFCPMKPGRWLQVADQIANPYFGSQMLTCGVFE